MEITIDRFEGDYAVVELPDGEMADVPKQLFPDAKEGDIFSIQKEEEKTQCRKEKIKKLMDEIWE